MQFEPLGGFPPIIRLGNQKKPDDKTLESRGFASSNIVSIGNIMKAKKEQDLFIAFGSTEEEGTEFMIDNFYNSTPNNYEFYNSEKINKKK